MGKRRPKDEEPAKQETPVEEEEEVLPSPAEAEVKEVKHSPFCTSAWSNVCNCGAK